MKVGGVYQIANGGDPFTVIAADETNVVIKHENSDAMLTVKGHALDAALAGGYIVPVKPYKSRRKRRRSLKSYERKVLR